MTLFQKARPGQACIFLESRDSEFAGKQFNQSVLQAYRNQGFKLIGVDQPGVATIDERTAYMSTWINESFKNGTCSSGAAFLGKGHLEDVGTGNVQKLIQVKFVSVDIVSTDFALPDQPGEDSIERMRRKFMDQRDILWRHCQPNQNVDISKIASSIAVTTSDLTDLPITKQRRMIDVYQEGPFWSTYDLLIVSNPQ